MEYQEEWIWMHIQLNKKTANGASGVYDAIKCEKYMHNKILFVYIGIKWYTNAVYALVYYFCFE